MANRSGFVKSILRETSKSTLHIQVFVRAEVGQSLDAIQARYKTVFQESQA